MFLFFFDVVETTSNYVSLDVDTIQMGVTCILLHLIHCTNSAKRTPFHQREFLVIDIVSKTILSLVSWLCFMHAAELLKLLPCSGHLY